MKPNRSMDLVEATLTPSWIEWIEEATGPSENWKEQMANQHQVAGIA